MFTAWADTRNPPGRCSGPAGDCIPGLTKGFAGRSARSWHFPRDHAQSLRLSRQADRQGGAQPLWYNVVQDEISPETLHADLRHEPDPARKAERERLGLLGRLATFLCLIEIYGHAPNAAEFRTCLAKHIASWQRRTRDDKKDKSKRRRPSAVVKPFLWIIAASTPTAILTKLRLEAAPGWPAGVYLFGDDILRVGIVVASELPRDRTTLLVRLMAAGPLLAQAIKDLSELPPKGHERTVAERILLGLQDSLRKQPKRNRKEQEFIVAMHKTWEEARAEARTKGLTEGRAKGRAEAQANAVLTALRVRGIAVSEAARKRILAQKELSRLERWLEKAIVATSFGEVIDDRAEDRSSKTRRPAAHKERSRRRSERAPAQR